MAASETDLGLLLTRLVGGATIGRSDLDPISPAVWQDLSARAAEHRMQPLLHAEWAHGPLAGAIPEAVRSEWAQARRLAAMRALARKAELARVIGLLADRGMAVLALKGAWLAWHAYPSPDMRPMRDLDLLVEDGAAETAWHVLHDAGFVLGEELVESVAEWARRYRHLPALISPEGNCIEVHAQLWDCSARNPPELTGLFARARTEPGNGGIRYLGFVDTLAHLSVHAANGHRFDCGPQVMADIDVLVRRAGFAWPSVWDSALSQGWARSAALVLAVTDRWRRPGLLAESQCPVAVPDDLVEAIPCLMGKPKRERGDVLVKLTRSDVSTGEKLRRLAGRRQHFADTRAWLGWLGQQAAKTTRALLPQGGRQQVSAIARLDAWLQT